MVRAENATDSEALLSSTLELPPFSDFYPELTREEWMDMETISSSEISIDLVSISPHIQAADISEPSHSPYPLSASSRTSLAVAKQIPKWISLKAITKDMEAKFHSWKETHDLYGWRVGVLGGLCMAGFVLCSNTVLILVGAFTETGYQNGLATISQGDAESVSRQSTMYHILINVLSTILLAASNYTMQVLSSPTRENLDSAHAKRDWVDVGILSTRNLRWIPRTRLILWLILGMSSVPLHLFYNSSIFRVTTGNQYNIEFVSYGFANFHSLNLTKTFANLTNTEWQQIYDTTYISSYSDIYLVVDAVSFDLGYLTSLHSNDSFPSLDLPITVFCDPIEHGSCLSSSNSKTLNYKNGVDWLSPMLWNTSASEYGTTLSPSLHVRFAFAKSFNAASKIQISLYFMITVIIFNIVKIFAMLLVYLDDQIPHFITVGDAVASLLETPDLTTAGICALSKEEVLWKLGHRGTIIESDYRFEKRNQRCQGIWESRRRHYMAALSTPRRMMGHFFLFGTLLAGALLLSFTGVHDAWGTSSTTTLPFGINSFDTYGILFNAWLSNAPQLLLSVCYLTVNGIFTCMALAYEWNQLGRSRKGLRVTNPKGKQRTAHFLQLPFKFAIPLTVISCLLHWLMSQSLFLVRLDIQDRNGALVEDESILACGASQSSFLTLLIVLFLLICVVVVVGSLNFQIDVPFAASCSLTISAACHPPPREVNIQQEPVKWGVVENQIVPGVDHCSFSMHAVKTPKFGVKYA